MKKEIATHRCALLPDSSFDGHSFMQKLLRAVNEVGDLGLLRPGESAEFAWQARGPPDKRSPQHEDHSAENQYCSHRLFLSRPLPGGLFRPLEIRLESSPIDEEVEQD